MQAIWHKFEIKIHPDTASLVVNKNDHVMISAFPTLDAKYMYMYMYFVSNRLHITAPRNASATVSTSKLRWFLLR